MSQIPVRFTTQQMTMPLLSQQSGRTIITAQNDLTYVPGVSPEKSAEVPTDRGIPIIYYGHNIMPSTYGMQSISYEEEIEGDSELGTFLDIFLVHGADVSVVDPTTEPEAEPVIISIWGIDIDISELLDPTNLPYEDNTAYRPEPTGVRTYIAPVDVGAGVVTLHYLTQAGVWTPIGNSPSLALTDDISTAFVNGMTYIWVPTVGVCIFNPETGVLAVRDLNTIDVETMRGITASNGYLIIYNDKSIAWSSSVDIEDFEPSDISGAGGGSVQEAKGEIVVTRSTQLGFLLFTKGNIVSVIYTGNDSFPFEFKEVAGSGGVHDKKLISVESIKGDYYAYTTSGIQKVSNYVATTVLSDFSDFIDARVFEDFNESTDAFSSQVLTEDMDRTINVIANRYVVVSYSVAPSGSSYTHALIADLVKTRIGKLKVSHTKCLEFRDINIGTYLDSRGNIAFLQTDGTITRVNFALNTESATGVVLFGKVQAAHNNMLNLDEVHIENVGTNFTVKDLVSMDGKTTYATRTGYAFPEDAAKKLHRYYFDNVALSHSLLMKGDFELITVLLMFLNAGNN